MCPRPASGAGSHRVVIEGEPRLEITVEAETEGGNRAAGGNRQQDEIRADEQYPGQDQNRLLGEHKSG